MRVATQVTYDSPPEFEETGLIIAQETEGFSTIFPIRFPKSGSTILERLVPFFRFSMKRHLLFSPSDMNLPDLEGRLSALTIVRGSMLLVNFWTAFYLGVPRPQRTSNPLNIPARHYLKDAVDALLRGDAPDPCVARATGCSLLSSVIFAE